MQSAQELAESFINGNRRYVADEISRSRKKLALALRVAEFLDVDDQKILFNMLVARSDL